MFYTDICVDELSEFIHEKSPVILDMRDATAYNSGHIEGALPADEAHIRALMKQKSQAVLICCYHGHSSRELARFLCQMGLTDVYNLEGGWHAVSVHSAHQPQPLSNDLRVWLERHGFRGHSVHSRIDRAVTTLMVAAIDADTLIATELLDSGAELHAVNADGNQALWFACVSNHLPMLELLLSAGADLNHVNESGYTCLMYAASTGKLAVAKKFIEAGADITIQSPEGLNAVECVTTVPLLNYLRRQYPTH